MEQDFFQEGQYQRVEEHHESTNYQSNANVSQEANDFQWTNNTPVLQYGNSGSAKMDGGSYSKIQIDDQTTNKIRQEQEKLQEKLKEKADKEYQDKMKRKQRGHKQLQEFFQQKQKQKERRKQQNIQHEKELIQKNKKMNDGAGWTKVSENVNLKQGEYKGVKSIQRMRESIINKTSDERSA